VVLGVGINVNEESFPPELADRATSLLLATGRPVDRGKLLVDLLAAFEPAYDQFVAQGPAPGIARWRVHADLGRRCRIEREGAVIEGVVVDVDAQGTLEVRDEGGRIHRVLSGEIG
jgi:BirA family biotin operon repressor/biotin-[acetyl-CoA-carboxylase] ligase